METQTMTLTEFLLTRIAEDEAAAGGASDRDAARADSLRLRIVRQDATRARGEADVKRWIVEQFLETRHTIGGLEEEGDYEAATGWGEDLSSLATVLRHLAAVYADHPDYRPEWRA